MTNARKTEAVNLRMVPDVKELLRLAADREHRTLSNMLEVLVLQYCEQQGISLPPMRKSPEAGSETKR